MGTSRSDRLYLAAADRCYYDHVLDEIAEEDKTHWNLRVDDSLHLLIENVLGGEKPHPGDTLRFFGKGLGFSVRGVGRVKDGALVDLYRYSTEEESEDEHRRWVVDERVKRRVSWEAAKERVASEVASLSEPLKKRMEFFLKIPDWGPEFGGYELFCCKEADKIAKALKTPAEVENFYGLSWDDQLKKIPNLDTGHSGNTFGTSCLLARVLLERPEDVFRRHGAMCPLAGCQEYGCWSTTEEAKAEKARRE